MAKKPAKKRSSIGKNFIPKRVPDEKNAHSDDHEPNADVGGLPNRDLKKNLGCG